MANKRQLKKHIRYVCGDMAAEILCARAAFDGFDNDAVAQIIGKIANLQVQTLDKVSFSFDKARNNFADEHEYNKAHKAYYRAAFAKLNKEFVDGVKDIVKDMNAAMPQAVKDQLKAK